MDDPKSQKDNSAINNDKPQRPDDDNTNPFISFRRYADDQISSLMSSVMGLPAAFSKEHERWHAARQDSDSEVTGSGKREVWVKQWTSDSKRDGNGTEDQRQEEEASSWAKMWKPDGQEVKPEVTEDKDGGKTWHWSASWSWPPKDNRVPDDHRADDPDDAAQRQAIEEARRNAEKELQEVAEMFRSWFGAEDSEEQQQSDRQQSRGDNLLDWIGLGEHASTEKRAELRRDMEDRINWLEDEFLNVRDSFSGFGRGPWSHLRLSDEAREGSQILQSLDNLHSTRQSFGFPMMRGWGHPLSYFLDYSNPRTRWVLEHPYSPAVLESDAIKNGVSAPRYADAFEDLMRAERGLPSRDNDWERGLWPRSYRLLSNVYSRNPRTQDFWQNVEKGGEWYVPERRDGLPPNEQKQLESPSESAEPVTKDSDARDHMYERFLGTHTADPKTELDMYERFLGDSSSHHQSQPAGSTGKPTPSDIDVSASPILSTVTTTERNVAADGTVTTKVTLKKRFADGREETSETVNTSRGDSNVSSSGANKKSGGWFWSS